MEIGCDLSGNRIPSGNDKERMHKSELDREPFTVAMFTKIAESASDEARVVKFNLDDRCHCSPEGVSFGAVLRRDSAHPWLLQVGTPSFGKSH
jgi:hypothetical protein